MQTARIVQAVALMLIVAVAASCSASKEYTSKLFAPRTPVLKDSQALALRFLDLDAVEPDQANWVTTDFIMGRDTLSQTVALDKLAQVFPSAPVSTEATLKSEMAKTIPVATETKPVEVEKTAISKKNAKAKTGTKIEQPKTLPVPSETKSEEVESAPPVARNLNNDDVRSKRSRDK